MGRAALRALHPAYIWASELRAGDIQLINDFHVLHGRNAYEHAATTARSAT